MSGDGIAVVLTCFDLGRTIEESLNSVAMQARPADEVVLVDDGSTDLYTRQVLARLAHSGVRVFRAPHRGVSAARNLGVRATIAPNLVFLDGDDRLDPAYLERLGGELDENPDLDFVSCQMQSFGAASERWTPPAPNLIRSLTEGVVHISSMLRRTLFERLGGFDEAFEAYEDVEFWTRVLAAGSRGRVLPEPLFHYRVRSASNYGRAVQAAAHRDLMSRFYEKHTDLLSSHVVELMVAKERFLLDQKDHHQQLTEKQSRLRAQLSTLNEEIRAVSEQLRARNRPSVDLGDLRRTAPISPTWGLERGAPLDRHYIHAFLARHSHDIKGRVLEIKDRSYTHLFGGDRVESSDVLDIDATNPQATIVADLTKAHAVADDTFDCVVLTQTLGLILDTTAAVREVHRILKPGGVVLCTVPAAGRLSCEGNARDGDYWRFTEASARALFAGAFAPSDLDVTGFGNVLSVTAFLYGLSPEELTPAELEAHDPDFPLVYGVRAVKSRPPALEFLTGQRSRDALRRSGHPAAVLMYHRVASDRGRSRWTVDTQTFVQQLEALHAEGIDVLPLGSLVESARRRILQRPAVALTFDDGYVDALEVVQPALESRALPGTFFVVGETLKGPVEFWWDLLDRMFAGSATLPPALDLDDVHPGFVVSTATDRDRRWALKRLTDTFYLASKERCDVLASRLREWAGIGESPSRVMTPDQIKLLSVRPGVEIGAHSHHHVWLPGQPAAAIATEVRDSCQALSEWLARPIQSFAYPYGGYDEAVAAVVRDRGCTCAVTTDECAIDGSTDPWRVPRISVENWNRDVLLARCASLWS